MKTAETLATVHTHTHTDSLEKNFYNIVYSLIFYYGTMPNVELT